MSDATAVIKARVDSGKVCYDCLMHFDGPPPGYPRRCDMCKRIAKMASATERSAGKKHDN